MGPREGSQRSGGGARGRQGGGTRRNQGNCKHQARGEQTPRHHTERPQSGATGRRRRTRVRENRWPQVIHFRVRVQTEPSASYSRTRKSTAKGYFISCTPVRRSTVDQQARAWQIGPTPREPSRGPNRPRGRGGPTSAGPRGSNSEAASRGAERPRGRGAAGRGGLSS